MPHLGYASLLCFDVSIFVSPSSGQISSDDMYDYLHLTTTGYTKYCEPILDALENLLNESIDNNDTALNWFLTRFRYLPFYTLSYFAIERMQNPFNIWRCHNIYKAFLRRYLLTQFLPTKSTMTLVLHHYHPHSSALSCALSVSFSLWHIYSIFNYNIVFLLWF